MKTVVVGLSIFAVFICNGCGNGKNDTTQNDTTQNDTTQVVDIDTTKSLLFEPDFSDRELPNDIDSLKAIIIEQDEEIRQLENKLDECGSNYEVEYDYDVADGIRGRL